MNKTPKITLHHQPLSTADHKHCRLVLTEDPTTRHRFVENTDSHTEYRTGGGKWKNITPRTFRTLIRSITQAARAHQIKSLALDMKIEQFPKLIPMGERWFMSTLVENLLLASYEYTAYKSKPSNKDNLSEIVICCSRSKDTIAGYKRGLVVGRYANEARDIANTPGDDLTPRALALAAKKLAAGTAVTVKILGKKELVTEKMGLLLAVGKGSHHEPQLIVMEYRGAGRSSKKPPLVLIGKGITYDTGGLNVKPSGAMHDMHMDMSGGSSVIAAIIAAAKLGLKKNIVAIVPAAENAISSTSMRAGDIVTSKSGQTVEILHTDAEGRMVLADAYTYSQRFKPKAVIDVATLTGAALVALGQQASAVMTPDQELEDRLRQLGEESGDLVWPLPVWDEYKQYLKSSRADLCNIAANFSRFGGCIEGGAFLSHFAPKNTPWAHLDIAPRMDSTQSDKLAKGATGEPVRLLISFLENY